MLYTPEDKEKVSTKAIEVLHLLYLEHDSYRHPTHSDMCRMLNIKDVGYLGKLINQLIAGRFVYRDENERLIVHKGRAKELLNDCGYSK